LDEYKQALYIVIMKKKMYHESTILYFYCHT